jgi:hypothetical protein
MISQCAWSQPLPFYDDPIAEPTPLPPAPATPDGAASTGTAGPVSAAVQRFQSCRWRKPPENGIPECCAHRDVLPLTGTRGFDPEAWCTDCRFYKLRRTPKKRVFAEEPYWRP